MGATESVSVGEQSGNHSASASKHKDVKFLLGNMEKLQPVAQRLFSLGNLCLNAVNPQSSNLDALERNSSHQPEQPCSSAGIDVELDAEPLFEPLQQTKPLFHQQTFIKWRSIREVQNFYSYCLPRRTIVYIQPIDDFPEFVLDFKFHSKALVMDFFGLLQSFAQTFFSGIDVVILPRLSMNLCGWTVQTRKHSVTGQEQYLTRDFYPLLQKILPLNACAILGVVWTDLYPSEDMNFVLGESSTPHKAGIFSFGRCEPREFNATGRLDLDEINGMVIWKMLKVVSHELCHLFGMEHCTFFHCAMNESFCVQEALEQPLFLCPVCLRKLHAACGFDVVQRYVSLLEFLQDLNSQFPSPYFTKSLLWLRRCLNYLNQPGT